MKIFFWLIKAYTLILEDKEEWDCEDKELLKIIVCAQVLNPEKDSKYFVDLPLKREVHDIIKDFEEIKGELGLENESLLKKREGSDTLNDLIYKTIFSVLDLNDKIKELDIKKIMEENEDLQKRKKLINDFLDKNFGKVGSDLENYEEKEYFTDISQLPFMKCVKDEKIREIVKSILHIWTKLSKKSVGNVNSSLIPLKHPFIVPGGRFREFYYWDSLWILQGLLICDMKKAAEYLVLNFIDLIDKYGFIPNGTRAYYSRRTQPPLFCMMLMKLFDYSEEFHELVLGKGLKAAMKEYNFLKQNKSSEIVVKGKKYKMYVYKVEGNYPRPESLKEDFQNWYNANESRKNELYKSLKTSAESGIDFSSRWFTDPKDIKTIDITNRIPVDLNAIVYENMRILKKLNALVNQKFFVEEFEVEARMLKDAINELMWDEKTLQWRDFVISENKQAEKITYFSNFYPMIFGIKPPSCKLEEVYEHNRGYFMDYEGGVVAGEEILDVNQQWDYPNIWPPYNQLIIEFLDKTSEYKDDARIIAKKFLESVEIGFIEKKVFYEKYNTLVPGSSGSGGEYEPQSGFGWTNGTVLYIIQNFGDRLPRYGIDQ